MVKGLFVLPISFRKGLKLGVSEGSPAKDNSNLNFRGHSTSDQILSIRLPFSTAFYRSQFSGPIVKCGDANATVSHATDDAKRKKSLVLGYSIVEVSSAFVFCFCPSSWQLESDPGCRFIKSRRAVLRSARALIRCRCRLWIAIPRVEVRRPTNSRGTPVILS